MSHTLVHNFIYSWFQNHVDEAIEMYQEMHMWDEAIEVAEAKVSSCLCAFLIRLLNHANIINHLTYFNFDIYKFEGNYLRLVIM